MKVGYSYWGFLGDVKMNEMGRLLSTPDGNAFYSWCIIKELQDRGHDVIQIMLDRDRPAYRNALGIPGGGVFSKFCTEERESAYINMKKDMYNNIDWCKISSRKELKDIWDKNGLKDIDVILHEYRMEIPGRNDLDSIGKDNWQPDYFIQDVLIEYCIENNISLIIFDLDYKITATQFIRLYNLSPLIHLFELGHKWDSIPNTQHVEIPFKFVRLLEGADNVCMNLKDFKTDIVYVGNRYERDAYISKYIPRRINTTFYGNWLEPKYNDCVEKWPHIHFKHRAQTYEIGKIYNKSIATVLFAKPEYYKNGFMTARLLETIFYGCVPLFPIEYGKETIKRYAGELADELTVCELVDVYRKVNMLKENLDYRKLIIKNLALNLGFMDVQNIVNDICNIGRGELYG